MSRYHSHHSTPSIMDRALELLQPASRRYVIVGAVFLCVFLITRGAVTLPLAVGWSDARDLLEREQHRDALKRELAEYHRAIPHFRSPEGQEQARRMFYKYRDQGEIPVRPTPVSPEEGITERLNGWVDDHQEGAKDWSRDRTQVLRRWALDPAPTDESDDTSASPQRSLDDLAREAFEANEKPDSDEDLPATDTR